MKQTRGANPDAASFVPEADQNSFWQSVGTRR